MPQIGRKNGKVFLNCAPSDLVRLIPVQQDRIASIHWLERTEREPVSYLPCFDLENLVYGTYTEQCDHA